LLRTTARNAASMLSGSEIASIRLTGCAGLSDSDIAVVISTSRTTERGVSPLSRVGKSKVNWNGGRGVVMRSPSYLPFPSVPYRDRSGHRPPRRPSTRSADFCAAVRGPYGSLSESGSPGGTVQMSRGKPRSLPRTPAGFTVQAFDGYGLRDFLPLVRPVLPRIRLLLVRSRFRSTLPSGGPSRFRPCASLVLHRTGDFHPQTAGHAQHTGGEHCATLVKAGTLLMPPLASAVPCIHADRPCAGGADFPASPHVFPLPAPEPSRRQLSRLGKIRTTCATLDLLVQPLRILVDFMCLWCDSGNR
jgi:hypothetical protein